MLVRALQIASGLLLIAIGRRWDPRRADRAADVATLAQFFLREAEAQVGRTGLQLSDAAIRALEAHAWPGNVRELRHAVEHALIVCDGPVIEVEHLPRTVRGPATAPAGDGGEISTLQDLERNHIARVLRHVGGHRANAARLLGISERNLYRKIHEHGLDEPS